MTEAAPEKPAGKTSDKPGQQAAPITVKKYANRRLYNTESSSYITLDNLADMVREGKDFVVYDAKTGEDITRSVLTQIIVEEESKGRAMLPTNFLRQLIGFYGDNLQSVVPRYLDQAMAAFARQQQTMRDAMQSTMGSFLPPGMEEVGRQNMAMLERAMTLFSPFYQAGGVPQGGMGDGMGDEMAPGGMASGGMASGEGKPEEPAGGAQIRDELASLKAEVERLQAELNHAHGKGRPKSG
jgi:polyhydroxyalkanoate synthesis repressor PhaR